MSTAAVVMQFHNCEKTKEEKRRGKEERRQEG